MGDGMTRMHGLRLPKAALLLVPLAIIVAARAASHGEWAAQHAGWAALLFAWVVADTLGLAALAKAEVRKSARTARALLGAVALAGPVVLLGAGPAVRAAAWEMPGLLLLFGGAGLAWLAWSGATVMTARRGGASLEAALGEILPPLFIRFALREAATMRIALFSWGAPQDVPKGTSGHDYHRALAPLLWVLLGLQVIELGVVHLLLMLWNPTLAWVVFALTMAGIGWFVAAIKAIRLYPVLLTDAGVRVRSAMLVDFLVPYEAIAAVEGGFAAEVLAEKETLNLAILSSPNVALTLERAVEIDGMFGSAKRIERVALKLDDSAAFLAELERRR